MTYPMAAEQGLMIDIRLESQSNLKSNPDLESNPQSNYTDRFIGLVDQLGQLSVTDLEPLALEIQELADALNQNTQPNIEATSPTVVNLRILSRVAQETSRGKLELNDASMQAIELLASQLRSL